MNAVQLHAKILSNTRLSKDRLALTLEVPTSFKDVQPGQFLHIRLSDAGEPLLRRPLSVHKINPIAKGSSHAKRYALDLLYAVKGKGTALLAKKQSGEALDIIGPLGKGFTYAAAPKQPTLHILIAGGMGVAPLALLADKIICQKRHNQSDAPSSIIVLLGAATHKHIFCEHYFEEKGCTVFVATEDGSRGLKGTVTDLFSKKAFVEAERLKATKAAHSSVFAYACGPRPMLQKLVKECMMHKMPLQVSLEEFMGCGIGACLGCAILTKSGYQRVCSDGPVFDASVIVWKF